MAGPYYADLAVTYESSYDHTGAIDSRWGGWAGVLRMCDTMEDRPCLKGESRIKKTEG